MASNEENLSKKEKALMWAVYEQTQLTGGVCLIRPVDILKKLSYDLEYKAEELEPMLKGLELDDYLDFVEADNHGEMFYCITLHNAGLNFARVEAQKRRSIKKRILITALMGIISGTVVFFVKMLWSKIFP